MSAHDTQATGEAMRVVWERLGLTVHTTGPDTLDPAPDHLFAPSPQTEAEGLAPLQAVLASLPAGKDIAVVVMPRFVTAPSRLSALRGLTVPVRGKPLDNSLQDTLLDEINPHSHPVVLLNLDAGPRAPGDLSLTPAHELGHALGLAHRPQRHALMSAGDLSLRCIPHLSAAEWRVLDSR